MRNSLTFYLFLLLVSASCQTNEDEDYLSQIQGVWFRDSGLTEDADLSYRNEIVFNGDGTYEQSLKVVETNNVQNVAGYWSLTIGKYQIVGKRLRRWNISQYGPRLGEAYSVRDHLLLQQAHDESPDVGLMLDESGDILTLDYLLERTCPDFVKCIQYQTYFRSH